MVIVCYSAICLTFTITYYNHTITRPQGTAAGERLQLFEEAVQFHGTAPPGKCYNQWEKHWKIWDFPMVFLCLFRKNPKVDINH
jgi:hypothetical protein